MLWLLDFLLRFISTFVGLDVVLVEGFDLQTSGRGVLDYVSDQLRSRAEQVAKSMLVGTVSLGLEEDLVALSTVFCDDSLDPNPATEARKVLIGSDDDNVGMIGMRIAPVL